MSKQNKNLYDILEVSTYASPEIIKMAYKTLSLKHHPDKNQKNLKNSTEKMVEINHAYSILSNPLKKEEYDKSLLQPTNLPPKTNTETKEEPIPKQNIYTYTPTNPYKKSKAEITTEDIIFFFKDKSVKYFLFLNFLLLSTTIFYNTFFTYEYIIFSNYFTYIITSTILFKIYNRRASIQIMIGCFIGIFLFLLIPTSQLKNNLNKELFNTTSNYYFFGEYNIIKKTINNDLAKLENIINQQQQIFYLKNNKEFNEYINQKKIEIIAEKNKTIDEINIKISQTNLTEQSKKNLLNNIKQKYLN